MDLDIIELDRIVNIQRMNDINGISNTRSALIKNKSINSVASVVIKIIKTSQLDRTNKWNHLYKHPNIVEFLGISIKDENQSFLIMPFANGGNLRNYIKTNPELSFNKKMEIMINVANGISFLHQNDIVHENINPKNILLFDGVAKISSLPLPYKDDSKDLYFDNSLFDNIGYIDPSSILNVNYEKNKSVDIYSLGSLLWEIMSERAPFLNDKDDSILQLIIRIKGGYREVDATNIPEYNDLYKRCWNGNSLCRPTIDYVHNQLLKFRN